MLIYATTKWVTTRIRIKTSKYQKLIFSPLQLGNGHLQIFAHLQNFPYYRYQWWPQSSWFCLFAMVRPCSVNVALLCPVGRNGMPVLCAPWFDSGGTFCLWQNSSPVGEHYFRISNKISAEYRKTDLLRISKTHLSWLLLIPACPNAFGGTSSFPADSPFVVVRTFGGVCTIRQRSRPYYYSFGVG